MPTWLDTSNKPVCNQWLPSGLTILEHSCLRMPGLTARAPHAAAMYSLEQLQHLDLGTAGVLVQRRGKGWRVDIERKQRNANTVLAQITKQAQLLVPQHGKGPVFSNADGDAAATLPPASPGSANSSTISSPCSSPAQAGEKAIPPAREAADDIDARATEALKRTPVSFLSNLDAEAELFSKSCEHLKEWVPEPLLPRSAANFTSLTPNQSGINTAQLYVKMKGCTTPAHQENNNLMSLNINLGPGTCAWYAVKPAQATDFERFCQRSRCKLYGKSGVWPSLAALTKAGIEVDVFEQQPGEAVLVLPASFHWVRVSMQRREGEREREKEREKEAHTRSHWHTHTLTHTLTRILTPHPCLLAALPMVCSPWPRA